MSGIANRRFVMMGGLMLALSACGGVEISEVDSSAAPDAGANDASTDGATGDANRFDAGGDAEDGGIADDDAWTEDAGVVEDDAAVDEMDASAPEDDAAVVVEDDAAVPDVDAGSKGGDDAGPIETDAGPIETDAGPTITPVINEYVFQHQVIGSGTVNEFEFVEILGEPNTDYSSLTIIQVSGNTGSAGRVEAVIPVGTTDADGYWLYEAPDPAVDVLKNSSSTLMLVSGFTGAVLDDLDTNNDGVLDASVTFTIIDSVAIRDMDASDFVYGSVVLERSTPLGTGNVSCASRIPNGVDTDTAADWVRNDLAGAGLPGGPATASTGEAIHSPGAPNHIMP